MISRLLQRAILGVARVVNKAAGVVRRMNEIQRTRKKLADEFNKHDPRVPIEYQATEPPPGIKVNPDDVRIN